MNNFKENDKITINDQIKKYEEKHGKSLSHLYLSELFDFVKNIPEDWSKSYTKLASYHTNMQNKKESLPSENFKNLLTYVNVLFFNEIKKKLQTNEKYSKTTKIKFNTLDKVPSKSWISKVEDYISEVELLLREILKSNIDYERNFKITMILSNDFSNLLKIKRNKLNNGFYHFAKFDNLLNKYDIQPVSHDLLNKSNEFTFKVPVQWYWGDEKINLNLKKNIIWLVITKIQDDFRFKIHDNIEFWSFKDFHKSDWKGVGTIINFDKNRTNLSKATIFAIKS